MKKKLFKISLICLVSFIFPQDLNAIEKKSNKLTTNISMKTVLKKSILINNNTLLLPIKDTNEESIVILRANNNDVFLKFNAKLTDDKPDYYLAINVEPLINTTINVEIETEKISEKVFEQITQTEEHVYDQNEKYRPLYHFAPSFGWMNDPNGLFFDGNKYHIFYQYNPYGNTWGNMSWGHTTTKDFNNFEQLGPALLPTEQGAIFSGSIIIDTNNDAGFGKDAILAFYTSDGVKQNQHIAYSTDGGKTFIDYENNPVLTHPKYVDFRDPKLFWHKESNQWIMSLATTQVITFYGSKNLKDWHMLSDFGEGIGNHDGVWECPDLIRVDYNGEEKWILLVSINPGGPNKGSATQYFIGNFDGKKFTADPLNYPLWIDYGRDNYAGVTFHNNPRQKTLFIGWMNNWDYANFVPSKNFRSSMTLPRLLELDKVNNHLIVKNYPTDDYKNLRKDKIEIVNTEKISNNFSTDNFLPNNDGAYELDIDLKITDKNTNSFTIKLSNTNDEFITYTFNLKDNKIYFDRAKSGLVNFSEKYALPIVEAPIYSNEDFKLKLFVDKASTELFINNGETVLTNLIFPTIPYNNISIDADKNYSLKEISVYELAK